MRCSAGGGDLTNPGEHLPALRVRPVGPSLASHQGVGRYDRRALCGRHHHHPDKTRLIRFGRHAAKQREKLGEGKPETFDFLGFTHFCTRSRKWGSFVIGRKTIKKRMRAKLLAIKIELRKKMHDPIAKTGGWMKQMLQGHLNYFAVSGNDLSLWWFFNKVKRCWLASLRRRSQTARLNWEKFIRLVDRFFPPIRRLHPSPCHRFDAKTRGRSPVR